MTVLAQMELVLLLSHLLSDLPPSFLLAHLNPRPFSPMMRHCRRRRRRRRRRLVRLSPRPPSWRRGPDSEHILSQARPRLVFLYDSPLLNRREHPDLRSSHGLLLLRCLLLHSHASRRRSVVFFWLMVRHRRWCAWEERQPRYSVSYRKRSVFSTTRPVYRRPHRPMHSVSAAAASHTQTAATRVSSSPFPFPSGPRSPTHSQRVHYVSHHYHSRQWH